MVAGLLVLALAVTAAVLIRQDVSVTPEAKAPDVVFAQGADYAAINSAGFATVTIGASGTSATLSASGVPGAASVKLGDVMQVENTNTSQAYSFSLARSAAPDAAITGFIVEIQDASDTVLLSWDAAASASSASISLPAATTYDISVYPSIADGTAAGALPGFDVQFEIVPA